MLGLECEVAPAEVDEKAIRHRDPELLTRQLAEAKARAGAAGVRDAVVIGADAVVALGDAILEKPRDEAEALDMLRRLSGAAFRFVTAVAAYGTGSGRMASAVGVSEIRFRPLNEAELRDYVSTYPVLQCAGAFEEDAVLRFAERVAGSYNFRTGLPVDQLVRLLREHGVRV